MKPRVTVMSEGGTVTMRFQSASRPEDHSEDVDIDIAVTGSTLGAAVRALVGKIIAIRDEAVEELSRVGINITFEGDEDAAPEEMPS